MPNDSPYSSPSGETGEILPAAEVAAASIRLFGLSPRSQFVLVNRSENDTYLVTNPNTAGEKRIIRVCRPGYHGREALESELAWMSALRDGGIFTPEVVPGVDGKLVQQIVPRDRSRSSYCMQFKFVDGEHPSDDNALPTLRLLGKISARMHRHVQGWTPPPNFVRHAWDFEGTLGSQPIWGPWRAAPGLEKHPDWEKTLERAVDLIERRLTAFGKSPDRFGLIHADLRYANILVHRGEPRVIDFDDSGFGWFLYDLASAVSFLEHRPDIDQMTGAWLEGYASEAPLSKEDLAEVPTFLLLRRITILAWMGSHSHTDLARELGSQYLKDSVALAQKYLDEMG